MLSDSYKQDKGIESADNIKFPDTVDSDNMTFTSRLMCQRKVGKAKYSFLVKGFETKANEGGRLGTQYYQVTLDDKNFTFSIQPIDEKTFGGECHE
jgi:hypothetical protein